MPKVLPSPAAPADAAAAAAESSSRAQRSRAGTKSQGGAFDQVLNGARRREQPRGDEDASSPPAVERDRGAERTGEKKRADGADRAKRREAAEAKAARRTEKRKSEAAAADGQQVDPTEDAAEARPAGEPEPSTVQDSAESEPAAGEHDADDGESEGIDGEPADVLIAPPADSASFSPVPAGDLSPDGDAVLDAEVVDSGKTPGVDGAKAVVRATDMQPELAALVQADGQPAAPNASAESGGQPAPGTPGEPALAALSAIQGAGPGSEAAASPQQHAGVPTPPAGEAATDPNTKMTGTGEAPRAEAPAVPRPASSADVVEAIDAGADAPADGAGAVAAAPANAPAAPSPDLPASASDAMSAGLVPDPAAKAAQPSAAAASQAAVPPEVRFAEDNHANIVREMRGQLMPEGGTMRLRLDPPELGPLAVTVRLRNGVMEASFETSSEEAAKLLSHSLGALKASLETHGVHVERLNVQQAPKAEPATAQDGGRDAQQQGQERDLQQEQSARQEHQRREMLRRMWRKLSGTDDPLDMVA
jgi:flagellar hook-length control protein FliK